MVSKGSRLDDADGNPVLLVRQRHGGWQLAWRVFVVGNILKSGVDGGMGLKEIIERLNKTEHKFDRSQLPAGAIIKDIYAEGDGGAVARAVARREESPLDVYTDAGRGEQTTDKRHEVITGTVAGIGV